MSFLSELLAATRPRIEEARTYISEEVLEQRLATAGDPRGFASALKGEPVSLIAEIKRATPSKGDLDLGLDARKLAQAYADGGAAALSVLTEPDRFKGSLEDLAAARACGLPTLRKDFIVDPWQILESRAWGADAVLLIVRCIGERLEEFLKATSVLGMDALVEVFDENDVRLAVDAGATLIGVNHRDLETFEVDEHRTERLAPMIVDSATLIALSGVSTRSQVDALVAHGARAVLVGEALVTADDPALKIKELVG